VSRCIIVCLILATLCLPCPAQAAAVKTGAQLLDEMGFAPLKGKRFALITNQSAQVGGVHLIDLMARHGVAPALIFTPEHGLKGAAEDGVHLADSSASGIPVKSLYGSVKQPQPADLQGIELVLFDIQDVGARFYTYISTMGLAMQACARAGIPLWVLDRPNPLGGDDVAGFVRRDLPASFTSLYPIPIAHGMTVGELARMIQGEAMLPDLERLELGVVPLTGWRRTMRWSDTGLAWVATSPNLASFPSTLLYPGIGLLEGTSASEGRGSDTPFLMVGWPGLDPQLLAQRLNAEGLKGLHFEPVRFTPVSRPGRSSSPKYRNRELGGVRLEIDDPHTVEPVRVGVAVLCGLFATLPEPARRVLFRPGFDDMAGSRELRLGVLKGESAQAVSARWADEVNRFRKQRERYLLYPE